MAALVLVLTIVKIVFLLLKTADIFKALMACLSKQNFLLFVNSKKCSSAYSFSLSSNVKKSILFAR